MKTVSISKAVEKYKQDNIIFVIAFDEKNKRPSGMVAGWTTICSADPYMLAVALWKKGYTHKLIHGTKEFVVAVSNKKLKKAIDVFGGQRGDKVDKFKLSKVASVPAKLVKPPLLSAATINLECKLVKEITTGDHILFIGKIVAAHIDENIILSK